MVEPHPFDVYGPNVVLQRLFVNSYRAALFFQFLP